LTERKNVLTAVWFQTQADDDVTGAHAHTHRPATAEHR